MATEMRRAVNELMAQYGERLRGKVVDVLDVGIAGDQHRPSDNAIFFPETNFMTLDIDSQWKPDFVGDICATEFKDGEWDLVILSQTLEHILDYQKAVNEVYRITSKYAIINCPFFYPYHAEPRFGDYWRMSKDALLKVVSEAGFSADSQFPGNILSSALCKKTT